MEEMLTPEEVAKVEGTRKNMRDYAERLYTYGAIPTTEGRRIMLQNIDDVFDERWGPRIPK